MSREEVQKLLGGYATGTLTSEEQQALFEAALDDQEIFDALAKEQPLRDLLRDQAAKAEILAALDGSAKSGGWMQWMRAPWVTGLAMAGLAAIGVAVWIGHKPAPEQYFVAQHIEPRPQAPPYQPPLVNQPSASADLKAPDSASPRSKIEPATRPRQRSEESGRRDKDQQVAAAPAAAPFPPPPAAPAAAAAPQALSDKLAKGQVAETAAPVVAAEKPRFASSSQSGQQQNGQINSQPSPMNSQQNSNLAQNVMVQAQAQQMPDARMMFYEQQREGLNSANGFLGVQGISAGAAEAKAKRAVVGGVVAGFPVARMGLKLSIVRESNREVDLSTALYAGESVKLRIVPNTEGFLYVFDGDKILANGQVKPNQKFDTPDLTSAAPGQRQFRIVLSRVAISPGVAGVIDGTPRADVVESKSEKDSATYAVLARFSTPQERFVQPVTLTWR
jgi:hypothetical protein